MYYVWTNSTRFVLPHLPTHSYSKNKNNLTPQTQKYSTKHLTTHFPVPIKLYTALAYSNFVLSEFEYN